MVSCEPPLAGPGEWAAATDAARQSCCLPLVADRRPVESQHHGDMEYLSQLLGASFTLLLLVTLVMTVYIILTGTA